MLAGVRVLDFGRYVAGPWCAAMLGDHGADVIRIEKREGSEDRHVMPVTEDGSGALFLQCNRNKRSMTLNLSDPGARDIVARLVASADVVIANLPRQALEAAGLDFASLSRLQPDIVSCAVSAFGDSGPLQAAVGFDGVAQAMSGAPYLSGTHGIPHRAQVNWVDFGTAAHCAFAIMLALMERQRTGKGQEISSSLLANALAFGNCMLMEQALTGIDRPPLGNRSASSAPTDIFQTLDGAILTQVVSNPLFRRWTRIVGREEWLDDDRFRDDRARGEHGEVLCAEMARWCATRTTEAALAILNEQKIPASPVLTPQQALDHPQVAAIAPFYMVADGDTGRHAPIAKAPFALNGQVPPLRSPAPALGAHTDEILGSLGYSAAEIAGFRDSKVV